MILKNQSK